ncbi:hypothetical protein MHYP_G00297560 [Metynnis hypsauchen]
MGCAVATNLVCAFLLESALSLGSSYCVNGASVVDCCCECDIVRPAHQFYQVDVDAGRECVIKGLCMYLNEDPKDLVQEYMDMTEANTLSTIERTMVGIYAAKETPGSNSSDVGVILEGVVVLRDLENVALATAMLFGFFYILNVVGCSRSIKKGPKLEN